MLGPAAHATGMVVPRQAVACLAGDQQIGKAQKHGHPLRVLRQTPVANLVISDSDAVCGRGR